MNRRNLLKSMAFGLVLPLMPLADRVAAAKKADDHGVGITATEIIMMGNLEISDTGIKHVTYALPAQWVDDEGNAHVI